jgi:hypothetical protein
MATFTSLPIELIELIVQDLVEVKDLNSLRLTCKDIENKVLLHFSERCFRERRFMVSRKSLDTLLYIAHHPVFQKSLTVVKFGTEHAPDADRILPAIMRSPNWLNGKAKFDQTLEEFHTWMKNGEDVAMIARAIIKLENLQEIGVLADFDNHSYGFTHWTNESGFPPVMRTTSEGREALTIRRLVWTVLEAVEIARKPTALAFTVARGQRNEWCFLPSTVFVKFDVEKIPHTCDSIRSLKLRFDCQPKGTNTVSLKPVREFIASFRALEHLHLIQKVVTASRISPILQCGANPLFADDFHLQHLVSLSLEGVHFQTAELMQFLLKTRSTLRKLSMIACLCASHNYREFLTLIRNEISLDSIEIGGTAFGNPLNLLIFPRRDVEMPQNLSEFVFAFSWARCQEQSKMYTFLTFLLSRMQLFEIIPTVWREERGIFDIVTVFNIREKLQADRTKRPESFPGVDENTSDQLATEQFSNATQQDAPGETQDLGDDTILATEDGTSGNE